MKTRSHSQRHSRGGFTLIELLLVFGIISILATLFTPALNTVREKADTLVCISNLRALGVAIQAAIVDNDNTIPYVEIDPADPVYDPGKVELIQTQPKSLIETFKPYGISERNLQCPADLKSTNNFAKYGSSYQWRPFVDGEPGQTPLLYRRRGPVLVNPGRVMIMFDHEAVHPKPIPQNRLYLDGKVNRGSASRR